MRMFKYQDPSGEYTITEDGIINEYYEHWKLQMIKAKQEHLISRDNCIEDFVVVHWAWEIDA